MGIKTNSFLDTKSFNPGPGTYQPNRNDKMYSYTMRPKTNSKFKEYVPGPGT